jgi:hypothetical protein
MGGAMTTKYRCPVCKKYYVCRVPKGGDGSALAFPRHYIAATTITAGGVKVVLEEKKICPGSWREIIL